MKFEVKTVNQARYDSITGEKKETNLIWIEEVQTDPNCFYQEKIALMHIGNESKAQLLASAPDLLEKLNMAIGYIENTSGVNEEFVQMLKKTISKAEGNEE